MRRRFAALAVGLPISIAGCLFAHQVGYIAENPDRAKRAADLAGDGHSYFSEWAFLLFAALTVLCIGCLLALHRSVSGGMVSPRSARAFAASPLAVFLVQETSERAAAGNIADGLFEISVVTGALLQIPFGLIAFVVARAILRSAARVGQMIQRFIGYRHSFRASLEVRYGEVSDPALVRDIVVRQSSPRGPPPPVLAAAFG